MMWRKCYYQNVTHTEFFISFTAAKMNVKTNTVLVLQEALRPYQSMHYHQLRECEIIFRSIWRRISYIEANKRNKLSPLVRLNLLAELYESMRSRDELDCGLRRREELSHEDILLSQDLNSETVA